VNYRTLATYRYLFDRNAFRAHPIIEKKDRCCVLQLIQILLLRSLGKRVTVPGRWKIL
jgi:hypothetical protein